MENEGKHRKVYGRGFFDGLRAAGIDAEGYMNLAKIEKHTRSMSGILKKVFESMPSCRVSAGDVCLEMQKSGSKPDIRVVTGCLNSLKEMGLAKELERGVFMKVEAKQPSPVRETIEEKPKTKVVEIVQSVPKTPLDKLASIAAKVKLIANEIEEIAIEVESASQIKDAEAEKLMQLKMLLKSLG